MSSVEWMLLAVSTRTERFFRLAGADRYRKPLNGLGTFRFVFVFFFVRFVSFRFIFWGGSFRFVSFYFF